MVDKTRIWVYNGRLSVMNGFMQKSRMHAGEIAFHLTIPTIMLVLVGAMGYGVVELAEAIFVK